MKPALSHASNTARRQCTFGITDGITAAYLSNGVTGSSALALRVGLVRIFAWNSACTMSEALASAVPASSFLSMSTGSVSTVRSIWFTSGCRIVSVACDQLGLRTKMMLLFGVYDWIMNGPVDSGCLV